MHFLGCSNDIIRAGIDMSRTSRGSHQLFNWNKNGGAPPHSVENAARVSAVDQPSAPAPEVSYASAGGNGSERL